MMQIITIHAAATAAAMDMYCQASKGASNFIEFTSFFIILYTNEKIIASKKPADKRRACVIKSVFSNFNGFKHYGSFGRFERYFYTLIRFGLV